MATPKSKKGKKATKNLEGVNIAKGLKKPPPTKKSEVTGHLNPPVSPGMYYACWQDGCLNWVPPGYTSFWCHCCWALNV
jgi:hypothetical protein